MLRREEEMGGYDDTQVWLHDYNEHFAYYFSYLDLLRFESDKGIGIGILTAQKHELIPTSYVHTPASTHSHPLHIYP